MPSVSKAQQAIMGQAWALRQDEIKPKDIDPRYRKEIKKIAFGYKDSDGKFIAPMTDKELKKFAKTKSKDLPENVKDGKPVTEEKNPCWDGYKQVGMKTKDGKQVPNCVKESENEVLESSLFTYKGPMGFTPKIYLGKGIRNIVPYLNPDSKKDKAGKRNLENLKDYRDWIKGSKK